MIKKSGLGRGINNFIKDQNAVEKLLKQEETSQLKELSIDEIVVNENQARKSFNEESLNELADSIKKYGIIQPIVLMKDEDKYMIIAGERRFRAAKIAGLTKVPAIIKEISKEEADKVSLIENIQRIDLNPIEEALGYKSVLDEYKITQEELAQALGKSRQYIGNTIRLLKLDSRVIDFLKEGLLTVSHAKLLLSIKDKEKQFKEATRIIKEGATIKETVNSIEKPKVKDYDMFMKRAKEDLESILGTKVDFKGSGKVKKLVIEYYSEEDLSRICETILGSEY